VLRRLEIQLSGFGGFVRIERAVEVIRHFRSVAVDVALVLWW
jgi:hypothetical protein